MRGLLLVLKDCICETVADRCVSVIGESLVCRVKHCLVWFSVGAGDTHWYMPTGGAVVMRQSL